jgi:molybdenum cofactor cytidylyltransferase
MISAIVLAAGKSERMGRPKALLEFGGRTFLENILDTISRSSIAHTSIVVGHHRREIENAVQSDSIVFNPDYEQGMVTSLQTGIRALPPASIGAFLFLVDHPVVEVETIEAMIPRAAPGRIVQPTFEGRRGHPVFLGVDVLREILGLPSSQGADVVVRRDPGRIIEIPVNTPGILIDVDTPEEYEKLRRANWGDLGR